jgi:hypothetical protein
MKIILLLVLSVQALSPKALETLKKAGLDPKSKEVKAAEADGGISVIYHGDPETFSLEKLGTEGRMHAVRRFVFTRSFIRKLKADPKSIKLEKGELGWIVLPPDFSHDFATTEERKLVQRKIDEYLSK